MQTKHIAELQKRRLTITNSTETFMVHIPQLHPIYSVRQKKYPLKFFAIFSATARNFYMKFHKFITHSSSHKTGKQHCIIFNCDKVIEFLA